MFVPVQRAAVHKRIKEGKLTAFFFYITRVEDTFFGNKRKVKLRPYILLSMSECKAWVAEMKRRMGYVDEPDESLMQQRKKLKPAASADEPKTKKEVEEALAFADTDPKDKGNRKVRYEEPFSTENRQQDMFLLLAEAMAAMASDKTKAEFYQKRLERGMEWDKKNKKWKWKE